jgi:hypothetical protein
VIKKVFKLLSVQFLFLLAIVFQLTTPQLAFAACGIGQIDLLEYMGPNNGQNYDLRYCSPNGSGSEPMLVQQGNVFTETGTKSGFFQNKGSNYEAYFYDDSYIYFYEDISWDEQCGGQEAFYRVFTPGEGIGGKIPRCINPGSTFSSNQQIKAYYENNYHQYTKTASEPMGDLCSDAYNATTVTATVDYAGGTPGAPVVPGTEPTDTIVMTNVGGAGTGEEKYYTKGYGLTGFRSTTGAGVVFESLFFKDGLSTSEPILNCVSDDPDYNLDIYPEYDVDETRFYLSPIKNVIQSSSTQRTVANLRKELALQGYQAYCASEDVPIDPEYNTEEKIARYFLEENYDGPRVLQVDAVEELNTTYSQYPIWRDVSDKQYLMASLEEYFGFRDVYVANPSMAVLTSSPINSLLSEPQMCVQGWLNIVAQKNACDRLREPGECELLTRPIPGTDYTVQTLAEALEAFEPAYYDGLDLEGCKRLLSNREENKDLLEGLVNTPTYFDRSYRYGFIVAVIHTKPPGDNFDQIFNFFTQSSITNQPRDEVLVVAFKLPDIGTNKGGGDDTGSTFWSDPLDLTRKLLFRDDQNKTHENFDRDLIRREILDNAIANEIQTENSKIYCVEGELATVSCRNAMTKAIVDIINGTSEECGEFEPVQIIRDMAGMDNPAEEYGKFFTNENGGQVMINLFLADLTHPLLNPNPGNTNPMIARTEVPAEKLKSIFTLTPENWAKRTGGTTVDFYVVYPMGFELDKVEEAIKGAFFSKKQLAYLEGQNTIENFEMTELRIGLGASTDGFEYEDKIKTRNGECGTTQEIDPDTGLPTGRIINNPCIEQVSVTVKQGDEQIGILGAELGFWMRKVQMQLNSKVGEAWAYLIHAPLLKNFY